MLSVCSQLLQHFKRFLLWLTRNCFPKQVPLPPPLHSALGSADWSWHWPWAYLLWTTTGEGGQMPGQTLQRRTQCFLSPGISGNGPKSFKETPYIPESDLSPGMPEDVLLL